MGTEIKRRRRKTRVACYKLSAPLPADNTNQEHYHRKDTDKITKAYQIATQYAKGDKELITWYYVAYRVCSKVIPIRDLEDLMHEIILKYLSKHVKQGFLLFLLAKETVVQYYKRGKIEDRVYRNILLTKAYWQKDRKTNKYELKTKYDDEYAEEVIEIPLSEFIEETISDETTIELVIDKVFFETLPYQIREILIKRDKGEKLTWGQYKAIERYAKKIRQIFSLC